MDSLSADVNSGFFKGYYCPNSITVELPSLGGDIESYDGISHKRRAIVAVILSMTTSSNNLVYDPGVPTFVDLNNTFPIP
jgi:hypothetical protein